MWESSGGLESASGFYAQHLQTYAHNCKFKSKYDIFIFFEFNILVFLVFLSVLKCYQNVIIVIIIIELWKVILTLSVKPQHPSYPHRREQAAT